MEVRSTLSALCAVLALVLLGCGSGKKQTPTFGTLTEEHLHALTSEPGLVGFGDAMLTYGPKQAEGTPVVTFDGCPAAIESNVLRNPGVIVYVFHPLPGESALSDEAKNWIRDFGKKHGYTVSSELKITPKYGPDGVTPMVMKGITVYEPRDKNPPVTVRVAVSFPSEAAAKDAMLYVDPDGYASAPATMEGGRPGFFATTIIPAAAAAEEFKAFNPLADKFGGKVEWVGGGR